MSEATKGWGGTVQVSKDGETWATLTPWSPNNLADANCRCVVAPPWMCEPTPSESYEESMRDHIDTWTAKPCVKLAAVDLRCPKAMVNDLCRLMYELSTENMPMSKVAWVFSPDALQRIREASAQGDVLANELGGDATLFGYLAYTSDQMPMSDGRPADEIEVMIMDRGMVERDVEFSREYATNGKYTIDAKPHNAMHAFLEGLEPTASVSVSEMLGVTTTKDRAKKMAEQYAARFEADHGDSMTFSHIKSPNTIKRVREHLVRMGYEVEGDDTTTTIRAGSSVNVCPGCDGAGKYVGFRMVVEDPCKMCGGSGDVE